MTTQNYTYSDNQHTQKTNSAPIKVTLNCEQSAGHGDHWSILTNSVADDVPNWLQQSIEMATIPHGLPSTSIMTTDYERDVLLISSNGICHINQVLAMKNGKPQSLLNAYPCVNSPYGVTAQIERIIACDDKQEAILRLVTADGTVIYAFDQLYAINANQYQAKQNYHATMSAWAYHIEPSNTEEIVRVEDADAIRYHRAFNDIVANNNGVPPEDIEKQIQAWQPEEGAEELAPVEINLGHMCAYLFGDTLGQEDEAWCQGQVLGKQSADFLGENITLFDVVILREPDAKPLVVRIATPTTDDTDSIAVNDYIQANIWLQTAIYQKIHN